VTQNTTVTHYNFVLVAAGTTDCLPAPPVFLRPTFPFLWGAACWARPERHFDKSYVDLRSTNH
jgi:hypothetical protein